MMTPGTYAHFDTTLGRAMLNRAFPEDFPYVNSVVFKSDVRRIIEEIIETAFSI